MPRRCLAALRRVYVINDSANGAIVDPAGKVKLLESEFNRSVQRHYFNIGEAMEQLVQALMREPPIVGIIVVIMRQCAFSVILAEKWNR